MSALAISGIIDAMPEPLQRAQRAVALPEVIEAMKMLARHSLGICMPHSHSTERDFDVLPVGMIQVERNQVISFETAEAAQETVPVAWRWETDSQGVSRVAGCNCCKPATDGTNRHNV